MAIFFYSNRTLPSWQQIVALRTRSGRHRLLKLHHDPELYLKDLLRWRHCMPLKQRRQLGRLLARERRQNRKDFRQERDRGERDWPGNQSEAQ